MEDATVVNAVREALTRATVTELSNRLMVSQPTIRRWAAGENLPANALRKPILKELGRF